MGRPRKAKPVIGGVPVKFWAIYAHCHMAFGWPLTIAYSDKPEKKLPEDHVIAVCAWTVDWRLARRVVQRCQTYMAKAGVTCDDMTIEWTKRLIGVSARSEGVPLYTSKDVERLMMSDDELRTKELLRETGIVGISRSPRS